MNANKARELFFDMVAQVPPEQWGARLAELAGEDEELRRRVSLLLAAHRQADSFLESPAVAPVATIDEPGTERPGTVIGPYKLLEQIGEGGFGVVFMAEQQQPIRRKVALKVVKPGMDTRQVIARFEAERQALALMDHPNIAQVHDGGETAGGRPYFVMELVHGIPITAYCDQEQLTPRQRLELFLPVCHAVQHAHQKGIIHRDIKPSNVLVTLHDGVPLVKIIDFGIAKAAGKQLTDKTLFTSFAQMIGTPLYMAPEQTGLGAADVDTRSDIYSLGVLLYELLTGTTAFDKERLKEANFDEIRRIISEEEPPRPSLRMTTLGQLATTVGTHRRSDPRQLSRLFRGELDWIVMKALEKDRNRRYESASALAADVQRYLHDEAVQACPPSAWYRFRKFARRNKVVLAIASCVLVALALGMGLAAWQWRLAVLARAESETRRIRAEQAEKKAQAINDFLVKEMLAAGTPEVAQGHQVTAEEVLDKAAAKVDRAFGDQPEVEAAVRMAIGSTYNSLGLNDKAEPHLQRALAIRQDLLGPEHPDTLETLAEIGTTWVRQGKYAEGERLYRQTLETVRRVLGEEHILALELEYQIAWVAMGQGRWDEAEVLFRQSLQKRTQVLGEEHADTLDTMDNLAFLLGERMGKWQEAEPMARQCLEGRKRVLGEDHPRTLDTQTLLAAILHTQGKWKQAEAKYRETLQRARTVSPQHDRRASLEHNVALMLFFLDQLDEAEAGFRDSVQLRASPEHPEALTSRMFLAHVQLARGNLTVAEREFRDLLGVIDRLHGPADFYEPFLRGGLGVVFEEQGKWSEAEATLRQAVAGMRRALPGHFWTPHTATSLAVLLDATGKNAEADALFRETLEVWRSRFPAEHPERAFTLCGWGEHLLAEGDFRGAEPVLTKALDIERVALPAQHRALGSSLCALGWLYAQTGRAVKGEPLLHEGLAICRRAWPAKHWVPADAESRLGGCLTALGKHDDAEKLLLGSYETLEKASGTPPQRRVEALDRLVKLYETWGRADKLAEWKAKRPAIPKPDKGSQPRSKDE